MVQRRVSIIGAALSANKGAAAMVETVVERLPDVVGDVSFTLLTTYPQQDAPKAESLRNVEVVGLEPLRLALVEIPVASIALLARKVRLPLSWVRSRGCRAILDSEMVVDVAGIAFSDGRGLPILGYNTLMTGLPLLLGVPTVKAAQALGPFKTRLNRTLAKVILSRVNTVCARGARTRQHLNEIGLDNVVDVSDLAFSLDEAIELPVSLENKLLQLGENFVVVMPSAVVKGMYENSGGDYVEAMYKVISGIRQSTGLPVVIAPHSYRVGHGEGRMNDGPVCAAVASRCADDPLVLGLDIDLTAGELRHLVARGSVLVTSRFHAMISGLSTATPTVVVGWSHKYREVLDDFDLSAYGCDSSILDRPTEVVDLVTQAWVKRTEISAQISAFLPLVREQSMKNFAVMTTVMEQSAV